jgi:hypothetical protein
MNNPVEIEKAASLLRNRLKLARLPELKLLCGLRFINSISSVNAQNLESYLREFVPYLAKAASDSNPNEFLPEEASSLAEFIELLQKTGSTIIHADDLDLLTQLSAKINACDYTDYPIGHDTGTDTSIACLFVEYYPDLGLDPRGRMLNLSVTANRISSRADSDDIVVRNPVSEPDDRFLKQARESIMAAREYLHKRHGLPLKYRYRFDFAVKSSGARFTGDSLGVAFAVGAIAALDNAEILRERLAVAQDAAFTGALSVNGDLIPVDGDALKIKIYRAFHSGLKYLIIPREHITAAWNYVKQLEGDKAERKLEIVGADRLDSVAGDPRLMPSKRSSLPAHLLRKTWKTKRLYLEIPVLMILMYLLLSLIYAPVWFGFDRNPSYWEINDSNNRLEVRNKSSQVIWSKQFDFPIIKHATLPAFDIDDDGKNEVLFIPPTTHECDERGHLFCYSHTGDLKFDRFCAKLYEFPPDTAGVMYDAGVYGFAKVGGKPIIISNVTQQLPARAHIRTWDQHGDSLGWYINRGHCVYYDAFDVDSDGQEELFFMGFNNCMGCVGLFVLEAESTYGVSPPYDRLGRDSARIKHGNQLCYILFPVTEIGRIPGELQTEYNIMGVGGIRKTDADLYEIYIAESMSADFEADIIYVLNSQLRVVRAIPTDVMNDHVGDLIAAGKLDHEIDYGQILGNVTYWTDTGWTTEAQLRTSETTR